MSDYPSFNEQIAEFGVYRLLGNRLVRDWYIQDVNCYNHFEYELHHYILEQEYYRYPERYKYKQRLILLPKQLHKDLHSAMSDARFLNAKSNKNYRIERDVLLYRHRKVENEKI